MFCYLAYGSVLEADVAIPELPCAGAYGSDDRDPRADRITLRLRDRGSGHPPEVQWFSCARHPDGQPGLSCGVVPSGYLVRFHHLADFFVDCAGGEIALQSVTPALAARPDCAAVTLRRLAIDQVMPRLLSLRRPVLHATAVAIDSQACAFIGDTGAGKSTLAGALLEAGGKSLCDDCLVLDGGDQIDVTPGYPGVRLWADALGALRSRAPAIMSAASPKGRAFADFTHFERRPQPLRSIYLLERAAVTRPMIVPLSPTQSIGRLIGSSFMLEIADHTILTRHFRHLARVARQVRVARLTMPDNLAGLPSVGDLVRADLQIACNH